MSRIFKHDGGNRPARKKSLTMLVSLALILLVGVGGTLAYLVTQTGEVKNTFTPAKMEIELEEEFKDDTKSNVYVTNSGEVAAYVRIALVPTWVDDQNQPVAVNATLEDDLDITWDSSLWVKGGDGFYYYTKAVAPNGGVTENLIKTATVKNDNGYKMDLQVLVQAIQSEPDKAVGEAWTKEGVVTVTGNNGTLTVAPTVAK